MQIIPVIDLKEGIVVHAQQGNRDDYAPLKSGICKATDIFSVVDTFSALFNFSLIYIADLNALTRKGDHASLLKDVLTAFPNVTFWIDSGYPICNEEFLHYGNFLPVLGTESFQEENIREISQFNDCYILSLDYSATGEMGAKSLFSRQDLWPENIIIMSLPRVGSQLGPDIAKLTAFRKQYPQHNIIAAGGVRDTEDLKRLNQLGIRHVLVASALHNGKISLGAIASLQAKKYPARGVFSTSLP
jgi:phosphoribosylformimino-5-aminoimidazole carboxamide ribotide isomerase